jgi:hypothetical protein
MIIYGIGIAYSIHKHRLEGSRSIIYDHSMHPEVSF